MFIKETKTCEFCFKRVKGHDIKKIKTTETSPHRVTVRDYPVCSHCFERINTFMELLKSEAWEKQKKEGILG